MEEACLLLSGEAMSDVFSEGMILFLKKNPTFCSMKFRFSFPSLCIWSIFNFGYDSFYSCKFCCGSGCPGKGWAVMELFYGTSKELISLSAFVKG